MPAELENAIDGFSRAAFHGNAAWFVGAGISGLSGLASWLSLLEPIAKQLGIDLTADDNLPAIAQYFINEKSGNRGPLFQHMRQSLGRSAKASFYHHQIARSNVGTIWTTNYDQLIEAALASASLRYRVRVRESDMVELTEADTIELIKAHGSFDLSSPAELVISTQDYEDYSYQRPATAARLRSSMLSKSFMFVGYGYGDPNIQTVLLEARRLAEHTSHPHYLLTTAKNPKDAQAARRQALWKNDLARIGIICVLLPDYAAIQDAVARISRRSRGPTLYVTGSHQASSILAQEVGKLLAQPSRTKTILLDGQSTGISRDLLSSFQSACVVQRTDLNERLRFFPNPYSSNPSFSNDPSLLPILKQWRSAVLRKTHTILAFDGGMGTRAEVELAKELGCAIVPVPLSNTGSAQALLDDPEISRHLPPVYVTKAKALNLSADDIAGCVLSDMPPWPY